MAQVQETVAEQPTAISKQDTPSGKKGQSKLNSFSFPLIQTARFFWLAGFLIFIAGRILSYWIFMYRLREKKHSFIPADMKNSLERLSLGMNIKKVPEIIITDKTGTPVLLGITRPLLLLPNVRYSKDELEFIFWHELVHYKRHDLWYKAVLLMANAIHWFNPFVYLLVKNAGYDIELACDEAVISGFDNHSLAAYGSTILSLMQKKKGLGIMLSTQFGSSRKIVKRWIENLFHSASKKRGITALCVMVLFTAIVTNLVTIQTTSASQSSKIPFLNKSIMMNQEDYEDFSKQKPFGSLLIHTYGTTWASAASVEGSTRLEQLEYEMKWLEQIKLDL